MPLDTFICGNCQGAFNNIDVFMGHKNEGCSTQQPEIIQLHVNGSGEITEITDPDTISGDSHSDTTSALQSLFGDGIDHSVTLESFEDGGTQTVIILNNSVDNDINQETNPLTKTPDQPAIQPVKVGRKPGRPRKGEGKAQTEVSVTKEAEKAAAPEKDKDGRLHCVRCRRVFTKERHFTTHKCLATSDYIDISKKDVIKMEAGEDMDLGDDDSDDAGAIEDFDGDDYNVSDHIMTDGGVQKLDVLTDQDPETSVQEKPSDYIEDIPVFKNEAEKFSFEQQLNVDLSCVDSMFKIHHIEQNLNEQADLMRNMSSSLSLYSCNVCEKVFKTLSHMRLHCLIHTDLKPFKCPRCDYSSNAKGNLYTHMRKHTGQFYRCKKCSFRSVNKSHLVEHESTHSSSRHQCALCKKDYNTVKSLINHIRKYHPFSAVGREYLSSFMKGHQRGATVIHQCHVCNRKFKKKIDRDRHLFVHDIKDLPNIQHCELCDYSASRRVYLEKHYQKHRVIYRCYYCDSKFPSTVRLIEHLTSVHMQDDTSQWETLFEKSIDNSLYLPEPQDSIKSKHANIPDEFKEVAIENVDDDLAVANDGSVAKSKLSLRSENPSQAGSDSGILKPAEKPLNEVCGVLAAATSELSEQSCFDDSVNKNNSSSEMTSNENKTSDGEDNSAILQTMLKLQTQESGLDRNNLCSEKAEQINTLNSSEAQNNSSGLMELGSEIPGDGSADRNSDQSSCLVNTHDDQAERDAENLEHSDMVDKTQSSENNCTDDAAMEVDVDQKDDAVASASNGTDRHLKDFIEKLGYRNMTMEIFHKLRETFGTEECEFCGKLFYNKTDFEPHVRTHTGDKPFVCDNDNCSFRAISKEILRQHVDREHGNVQFQCKECSFITNSRSQLWSHHLKHLGITGLQCQQCDQKFNSLKLLRGHLLVVHPELDSDEVARITGSQLSHTHKIQGKMGRHTYKCPYCDRVFTRANSELQKHLWMHEGIKPFKCPMCPYGCRSKNNLQNHMLRHSAEKPFLCNECGKAYKSRTALRWHVKSHKHGKLFKCDRCPYEATQRSHLKRHQETHDVLKRFVCAHCDYSANTIGYLKIHYAKSHKGLAYNPSERAAPRNILVDSRVYKCLSCDYIFGNLSDLKRHLRIRHQVHVQGITDLDQVQISEVQVVQCADDPMKESVNAVNSMENQQQTEETYTSGLDEKTASAVSLLQQIIDISQESNQEDAQKQTDIKTENGQMVAVQANNGQMVTLQANTGQMVAVQADDGQMVVVDPETIIVQQDGEQVVLSDGNPGSDGTGYVGGGYVIQYVQPGDSLLEEISLEVQSSDS